MTTQTYEDGAATSYRYNNDGALASVTDTVSTATYYYDFIDRICKYVSTGKL